MNKKINQILITYIVSLIICKYLPTFYRFFGTLVIEICRSEREELILQVYIRKTILKPIARTENRAMVTAIS